MASSAPPAIGDIPHFPAILYVKPVVGLNEQIFGVNEQISGRGQERLIDISLKVMCETRFLEQSSESASTLHSTPIALPLVISTSVSPNKAPVLTVVKTPILFFAAVVLFFAARRD